MTPPNSPHLSCHPIGCLSSGLKTFLPRRSQTKAGAFSLPCRAVAGRRQELSAFAVLAFSLQPLAFPRGRPQIQNFVGALAGQHAQKGIFITTSDFSSGAREYVKNLPQRVILIDGQRLTELMIEHNIGVSRAYGYEIKRVDSDYFDEG